MPAGAGREHPGPGRPAGAHRDPLPPDPGLHPQPPEADRRLPLRGRLRDGPVRPAHRRLHPGHPAAGGGAGPPRPAYRVYDGGGPALHRGPCPPPGPVRQPAAGLRPLRGDRRAGDRGLCRRGDLHRGLYPHRRRAGQPGGGGQRPAPAARRAGRAEGL